MEEYLLTDHMSDYSELLIQYADKVVKDHVEQSYSIALLDKEYMRFDYGLQPQISTVMLRSAIEEILRSYFNDHFSKNAPSHIIPDIKYQIDQTIQSINIYRSELETEKQNMVNYCLAMNFYLGCFDLYYKNDDEGMIQCRDFNISRSIQSSRESFVHLHDHMSL